MTYISAKTSSVNSESVVTNSGTRMTKAVLRDKASNRMQITVADSSAASYMWSVQVGKQYPSILDLPRRSVISAEHLMGLISSLKV